MILVADSGSTKADWVLADGGTLIAEFNTPGINPYFHDEKYVLDLLRKADTFEAVAGKVTEVRFFGAGCSSPARNKTVENALRSYFTTASVYVEHDMKGAALATCGDAEGIACIIGTGSNV